MWPYQSLLVYQKIKECPFYFDLAYLLYFETEKNALH